jgi:vitamin B12/bleomycin/antimicrobial peptide transport system ATP-binding/permease protein
MSSPNLETNPVLERQRTKLAILRDAWRIARPYWFSEEWQSAWGLLAAVVAANLINVGIGVRLNYWRNDFYNAMQNYEKADFFYQLGLFTGLASAFIVIAVVGVYLQQMLQIRWRRWMTNVYLREWLGNKTYYRLQLIGDDTDNPDQRISEDLRDFPAQTLNLSIGLVTSVVQAVSFAIILWDLSGPLAIPLGSLGELNIPGYMLWAALIYTAVFTWITMRLGRPLIGLNFQQQRREADFRFSLVRLREYSESVAFYGGEARELDIFTERFGKVFGNYLAIMMRTMILGFPQNLSSQAAVVFPYLVAAPRFFAEKLPLGTIQQVAGAFVDFQSPLAYIITSYNDIANWAAIVERLETFRDRVDEIRAEQQGPQPIAVDRSGEGVAVSDLELDLPDGKLLRKDLAFAVAPGEALLIRGPTGAGKSTLLRAIAGLWPFGHGHVRVDPKRAFFIPQKSYVPLGSLRHALVYPDSETSVPTEQLIAVLKEVGLERFASELDTVEMWSQRLSGGEQQRLALARVILAEPATIFLDEATAALDEAGQETLYKVLRNLPWKPTIISVGHRGTLPQFHDRVYNLEPVTPA